MRAATIVGILILSLLMVVSPALGCPGCQDNNSEFVAGVGQGYAVSIYFMLSLPFLVTGALFFKVYSAYRRQETSSAQGTPASEPDPPEHW